MRSNRCNTKYLAGHRFPKNVSATSDLEIVLNGAEDLFVAVPSFAVGDVMAKAKPFLSSHIKTIASITKGLDPQTLEPLVQQEARALPTVLRSRICTLGGPAIAKEMANGSPTGFVIAGPSRQTLARVKKLLETESVKCATSTDIRGVGLASALKNPYAIGLGICDGLKLPTNAKAMIMTVALEEMSDLIEASGGKPETVTGLAGLGDLFVTGMSPHGRNRTYGERLVGAKSKHPEKLNLTTVEGIDATHLAIRLAMKKHVPAPLLLAIGTCLEAQSNFERPFVQYLNRLKLG